MSDPQAVILDMEDRRVNAMMAGDLNALEALLAPEAFWLHANGQEDSRQAFLDGFRNGGLRANSLVLSEQSVLPFGDVCACHGTVDMTAQFGGEKRTSRNRYTTLWVASGQTWRIAFYQSTQLPKAT